MKKLSYYLNRLWLLFIRVRFKESRTIDTPDGIKEEIIIFSKKGRYFAQTTPFNTIILAENLFSAPRAVLDTFLLHEKGHKRTRLVFRCVYIWLMAALALLFFPQFSQIYVLLIIFMFMMHSWILEINAETHVAGFLGKKKYVESQLAIRNLFKEKIRRTRISNLLSILNRPPPKLFYWIISKKLKW